MSHGAPIANLTVDAAASGYARALDIPPSCLLLLLRLSRP
jgi:hypothetical protein